MWRFLGLFFGDVEASFRRVVLSFLLLSTNVIWAELCVQIQLECILVPLIRGCSGWRGCLLFDTIIRSFKILLPLDLSHQLWLIDQILKKFSTEVLLVID